MAVPKEKKSRSRRDMRRAHHQKITLPTVGLCAQCGESKVPHRICANCGYYAGREVMPPEIPEAQPARK